MTALSDSTLERVPASTGERPSGYKMIHDIKIRNFKCFKQLDIKKCNRINVIVGDNGAGKTALLEGIFLALGGSPELANRFRTQRGVDGSFNGTVKQIEETIFGDIFHNFDSTVPVSIDLAGTGSEARSVTVSRGGLNPLIPLNALEASGISTQSLPLMFVWRDSQGELHPFRPVVSPAGIQLNGAVEDLPDYYYFSATMLGGSVENASRYSDLSRSGRQRRFIEMFTKEYSWIEDLSIEVIGGSPIICAKVRGLTDRIPINSVSGSITKFVSVLLAMCSRRKSVVLLDEAENGVYYKHHGAFWRSMISCARDFDSQLFISTHNEEWLEAMIDAADGKLDDISMWRLERADSGPVVRQFSGSAVKSGIEFGGELR